MNNLQIFQNEQFQVRTIEIDGKPYFCASDVANALGYSNPRKAVGDHCKGVTKCDTLTSGGMQSLSYIPEGDIYRLIARSQLPEAEKFEKWVFDEVIPEIRKTGGYHLPQTYQEALRALADKVEQNEKLAAENAKLLPKAAFFDAVTDSKSAISIGEVAKVLDVGIGQNKLFAFLRDRKILDRQNIPYQEYIDRGYFRTIEQKYDVRGEVRISIKTLVFQKGIDFIRKQLQKEEV
jgi:prophage antirepressor-like protein